MQDRVQKIHIGLLSTHATTAVARVVVDSLTVGIVFTVVVVDVVVIGVAVGFVVTTGVVNLISVDDGC